MTTKSTPSGIFVLFSEEKPKGRDWDKFGKLYLRFVYLSDDGKPRNFSNDDWRKVEPDTRGLMLRDLLISAQYDTDKHDSGPNYTYGWTTCYERPYSITLETAEHMAKTLRTIAHKVDKLNTEWGHAQTFGQYALRICKAIGVQAVLRESKYGGSSYSDCEYQQRELTDLDYISSHAVAEGLEPFKQTC